MVGSKLAVVVRFELVEMTVFFSFFFLSTDEAINHQSINPS
jgi:hypothetical protein